MKRCVLLITVVAVGWAATFPSAALAALSPGKVKKMKSEASDVVQVKVTRVETVKKNLGKLELVFHAKIVDVRRKKSELAKGDVIKIHSYRLTGAVLEPGPKNPPLLKPGWQGTVWMNSTDTKGEYKIAVFGHSFEPEKKP